MKDQHVTRRSKARRKARQQSQAEKDRMYRMKTRVIRPHKPHPNITVRKKKKHRVSGGRSPHRRSRRRSRGGRSPRRLSRRRSRGGRSLRRRSRRR